jgi:hypothetical protein
VHLIAPSTPRGEIIFGMHRAERMLGYFAAS